MKFLYTLEHDRDFHINLHTFRDYAPEYVEETLSFSKADCVLLRAMTNEIPFMISREHFIANRLKDPGEEFTSLNHISLDNMEDIQTILKRIGHKPRIILLEAFGKPNPFRCKWNEDGSLPPAIRENDIPMAAYPIENLHPNGQFVRLVDNRRFYPIGSFSSRIRELTVNEDQARENPELMRALLGAETIDRINILACNHDTKRELFGTQSRNKKINASPRLGWPDGMREILSKTSWTLQLNPNSGIEMMGIEGAFCGAKPIYPSTPYYQTLYGRAELGTAFFDVDNPIESILKIVEKVSFSQQHRNAWVEQFGAEHHMPIFWERVAKIVGK